MNPDKQTDLQLAKKTLLLLPWGMGRGDKARRAGVRALRQLHAARKRRFDRRQGVRVAIGATQLSSGPVIALGCDRDAYAARVTAQAAADRAEALQVTQGNRRTTRAANRARVEAKRRARHQGDALSDAVRDYQHAAEAHAARIADHGTTAARAAMERLASDALAPARVTAEERKALRAARRALAKARRGTAEAFRPVFALTVSRRAKGDRGDVIAATRLDALARSCARSWVRAWLASGGRDVFSITGDDSQSEELACIYRARFAAATGQTGYVAPDMLALFGQRVSNPLPFRALLAWRRAHASASRDCRAWMWGKGWEECDVASFTDLEAMRAAIMGAPDGRCVTVSAARMSDAPLPFEREREARPSLSPMGRAALGRRVGHAAECLRVHWGLSGSREWRSALARDLGLLTLAARMARGGGWEGLDAPYVSADGDGATGALRERLSQWRMRVGSGDVLLTEQSDAAEAVLAVMQGIKQRKAVRAPQVAFVMDGDTLFHVSQVVA